MGYSPWGRTETDTTEGGNFAAAPCTREFPSGSAVKNSPANAGDTGDASSIPGSERSPGERNGNPLQYFCLGNPMDRYSPWVAKSWMCLSN